MTLKLPQHGRYDYSPITERKDYSWPGGKRLAFCVTTNIAVHAFGKGRGHDNAKHGEPQTNRNWSWRDYGNRIGIFGASYGSYLALLAFVYSLPLWIESIWVEYVRPRIPIGGAGLRFATEAAFAGLAFALIVVLRSRQSLDFIYFQF